ncbi:MAG: hypothetical protein M9924_17245 [Rhizobiaceae bacterium]|nr:hypothetical protein [Rhizobiaceae bacterium]
MSDVQAQQGVDDRRSQFQRLYNEYQHAYAERNYERALDLARRAREITNSIEIIHSEALCLHRLHRSQEAYALASQHPAARDNENYHDLMAEICGALGMTGQLQAHGSTALTIRERKFGGGPSHRIPDGPPPLQEGCKRAISYSLYGGSPRYCEVAIMNCQSAARLLPQWTCRFYCDETVPADVRRRLKEAGGEIILINDATRKSIPPLMWRFLCADDPGVSHFLMRDADSLIGEREAAAVGAWLESGKWFHVMRDYYTHTELMLAGLWGGCTGAIPDMRREIMEFIAEGNVHTAFVDQHFLRKRIWPTARQSVLSHDSQFDFFNNEPFPVVPGASLDPKHHVGANQSTGSIASPCNAPDGSKVRIYIRDGQKNLVCTYEAEVRGQRWALAVPDSYADRIESKEWSARFDIIR